MTLNRRDSYESSNHTCKWGIDGGQMFHIILENSKFRAHKPMTTDQLTYSYKFCSFIPLIVCYFPHIAMVFLLIPLPAMK
jgi:hypothetical protein